MPDDDLRQRTWQLLQPGDIALDGLIVHTDFGGDRETAMHQATVTIGECIATHAGFDPKETFVYSGSDDSSFASNQHQGLTLADESFVWECQQLLRDGSFDLVFYFERGPRLADLVRDVGELGYDATAVPGADPPTE